MPLEGGHRKPPKNTLQHKPQDILLSVLTLNPGPTGHPRGRAGRRKTGLPVGIERWVDEAVKPVHDDDERFLG